MANQCYTVTPHPIETLLTWEKSKEIAIPEIQRPFVWKAVDVRDLLDSLLRGYPIGQLIIYRNPTVKLKDGTSAFGKRILIDGQQRMAALKASLLGDEVLTEDYEKVHIRIAFHPQQNIFEVSNPAIRKDVTWLPDITQMFKPDASLYQIVENYCSKNPGVNKEEIFQSFEKLLRIVNNQVSVIELDPELTIETVTSIFLRVNRSGVTLDQADFAMAKIASSEQYDGANLRKAIDYFCHLAKAPEFYAKIKQNDEDFANTEFFSKMSWMKDERDDIYDPGYTDMLRVAFTSEFRRGRLADLVALLSGRNFETRQYEEAIAAESFARLKKGVLNFINETDFKRFVMIIRSAGFVNSSMIGSQNVINFAYILYLLLRVQGKSGGSIENLVRRWFALSVLTGRYSGSPETAYDYDVRQMQEQGVDKFIAATIAGTMSNTYWDVQLPQQMITSSANSPYWLIFQAAQIKMNDKAFLSRDITVQDLILNRGDAHHIFPKDQLKQQGLRRARYNQIGNYAWMQTEINIAIGAKAPSVYFKELLAQCNGGKKKFGNITDLKDLKDNLQANCIPPAMLDEPKDDYDSFLEERRKLMAKKVKEYFELL
jgi:hypothetical protein